MPDGILAQQIAISIHTPTRGVTSFVFISALARINFNPHSHEGSDITAPMTELMTLSISIHTPTRGVTHFNDQAFHSVPKISIHTPTRGVTAKLHNFHCILRNNFTNLFNISIILSLSYYISIPFLSFLRKLLGANLPILFCVLSIRTDWFIESAHHPQPSPVQPLYFPLSSYTYLPNNKISNYLSLHQ